MTSLMTKSSLYDMLSMIIPGFITLFSFAKAVEMDQYFNKNAGLSIAHYICIFALSYLVGLIIHYFSKGLFDPCLRNNPKDIEIAKQRFKDSKENKENINQRWEIRSWECGIVIFVGVIVLIACIACRIKESGIFCAIIIIGGIIGGMYIAYKIGKLLSKSKENSDSCATLDEYYKKYYQVIESSPSVPIMEAQVSFIRSMKIVLEIIIILIVVSIIPTEKICLWLCNNPTWTRNILVVYLIILLLIFAYILRWLMFNIQDSIYYRIFEDHYYIYGEGQCSKTTKKETTEYSTVTPSTITMVTSVTTFDEHNKLDGVKVKKKKEKVESQNTQNK